MKRTNQVTSSRVVEFKISDETIGDDTEMMKPKEYFRKMHVNDSDESKTELKQMIKMLD